MKIVPWAVFLLSLTQALVASAQDNSIEGFALMGVKLDMTPEQATQVLKAESNDVTDRTASCRLAPTQQCRKILAMLPDGSIDVLFQHSQRGFRSVRVALTVKGRGESDRDTIVSAAIDHYGPPTLTDPAWCSLNALRRGCRDDAPAMVFRPLAGAAGEFILRDASTGDP